MTHTDFTFNKADLMNIHALIEKAPITGADAIGVAQIMHKCAVQIAQCENPGAVVAEVPTTQMETPDRVEPEDDGGVPTAAETAKAADDVPF